MPAITIPPFPPPPRPTPTTLATLAQQVLARLQDPTATFWDLRLEVYPALEEAVNDLMLIIGRPTTFYQTQIQINPGNCFQPMPQGMLALTNLRANQFSLWKTSLYAMDTLLASWGPDWETDVADAPQRWFPVGTSFFGIHPAVKQPVTLIAVGIGYPFSQSSFPPTGQETCPFHDEFFHAIELYATSILRLKDIGDDAYEGQDLYQQYLQIAQRLSTIESRRDDLIFSAAFGAGNAISKITTR